MTDKAYIVANEKQEREVLEKLEQEGCEWLKHSKNPTDFIPSVSSFVEFPYVLINKGNVRWSSLNEFENDATVIYDGRKEKHMSNKLDRTLTIFTNNGQSFMFKHVTDFKYTTTGFEFSYTGEMTGVKRHAVFNNTSVAGYALAD